jgi:hypothetical protein
MEASDSRIPGATKSQSNFDNGTARKGTACISGVVYVKVGFPGCRNLGIRGRQIRRYRSTV